MSGSHFTSESSIDQTMWGLVAAIAMLLFVLLSVAGFSQIEINAQSAASATTTARQPLVTADFGLE